MSTTYQDLVRTLVVSGSTGAEACSEGGRTRNTPQGGVSRRRMVEECTASMGHSTAWWSVGSCAIPKVILRNPTHLGVGVIGITRCCQDNAGICHIIVVVISWATSPLPWSLPESGKHRFHSPRAPSGENGNPDRCETSQPPPPPELGCPQADAPRRSTNHTCCE